MNTPGYQRALERIDNIRHGFLDLDNLGLTVLPPIPNTVRILYCNDNQLTQLPELPGGLVHLYCNRNQLTRLPELPNSLQRLVCFNNPFEEPFRTFVATYERTQDMDQLRASIRAYYVQHNLASTHNSLFNYKSKTGRILPQNIMNQIASHISGLPGSLREQHNIMAERAGVRPSRLNRAWAEPPPAPAPGPNLRRGGKRRTRKARKSRKGKHTRKH
jgi:hypothetical protein